MTEFTKSQFEALFPENERPKVLSIETSSDSVTVELFVPEELSWFEGHFPDQKVLPGVVQIDWVIKLGQTFFKQTGKFAELSNVKFISMVLPNAKLKIKLNYKAINDSMAFHLFKDADSFSKGNVKFKAL